MAGKAQKAGKSKRPQSDRKKLARARCRAAAARRHEQQDREQELRHQRNLRLIRDGEMTSWQQACARRAARRLELCAGCRLPFAEDGTCATRACYRLGERVNLKTAWEKRSSSI